MERNLYSAHAILGLTLMGAINVFLFGIVPGLLILVTQIVWIPFWAAGVINGVGHWFGYRNFDPADASTNIVPWGILIGGEELHNNHHSHATSAKLSSKWYEFDIGWMYICILEKLGLATVKKVAPTPRFLSAKPVSDLDADTLHAVIANRYDVLARYAKSLKKTYAQEIARLKQGFPLEAASLRSLKPRLLHAQALPATDRERLFDALKHSKALETVLAMRDELVALWERSNASKEQLLQEFKDWCRRAESSGIVPLAEFSQRLRSYA